MAARLNRNHSELVLKRIQVSNLVTRLQKNALRQLKNPNDLNEVISMTQSEIDCAKFLIERTIAKAVLPQDLNINGNLTCVFRDPTDRPVEMNGYHRKPQLTDRD
jgi:hypothetical protein